MPVNVRVALRCRPLLHDERPAATSLVASSDGNYDAVFDPGSSQNDVYVGTAARLVERLFCGISGAVFAFGQTGSGKTYSMIGDSGGGKGADLDGVLPQAAADIFRRIAHQEAAAAEVLGRRGGSSEYAVTASFVEVHNERAYDLLAEAAAGRVALTLREVEAPPGSGRTAFVADGARTPRVATTTELMRLIATGSARRVTAATGVHDHSSRSHALLTLRLEHRWILPSSSASSVQRQTATLTLADLAGSESSDRSHGGHADRSGCAINFGLFSLTKVIAALGGTSAVVPYRDSVLTRLLKQCLGGNSETIVLACVSPARADASETMSTLRFAAAARLLMTSPEARTEVELLPPPPTPDPVRSLNRRAKWIQTRHHGDIFALVAGDRKDPLVLYVHGSGPRNSSHFWEWLVPDLHAHTHSAAVLVKAGKRAADAATTGFFHVAIDCPGYGDTPGDRQTIRSEPHALLSDVVAALGKKRAFALVGSSQGACAVLNAAVEQAERQTAQGCPSSRGADGLCACIAVCHPVAHEPSKARFGRITQPVLLMFDTEDAGHPVSVGRIMRRHLSGPVLWSEFAESGWEYANMASRMVELFDAARRQGQQVGSEASGGKKTTTKKRARGRRSGGRSWRQLYGANSKRLADLTRPHGGFEHWHGGGWAHNKCNTRAIGAGSKDEAAEEAKAPEMTADSPVLGTGSAQASASMLASEDRILEEGALTASQSSSSDDVWEMELDPASCRVCWRHRTSGRVSSTRPIGAKIQSREARQQQQQQQQAEQPQRERVLFDASEEEELKDAEDIAEELERQAGQATRARAADLESQRDCVHCKGSLGALPVCLSACGHVICGACAEASTRYFRECPVCHAPCARADERCTDAELGAAVEAAARARAAGGDATALERFKKAEEVREDLVAARRVLKARRVCLEFGNTTDGTLQTPFVRVVRVSGGARLETTSKVIKRVRFNINPSHPKAAVAVDRVEDKRLGFSISRRMKRSFPCFMTITLADPLVPEVEILYYTAPGQGRFRRRVVVQLPSSTSSTVAAGDTKKKKTKKIAQKIKKGGGRAEFDASSDGDVLSGWVIFSSSAGAMMGATTTAKKKNGRCRRRGLLPGNEVMYAPTGEQLLACCMGMLRSSSSSSLPAV